MGRARKDCPHCGVKNLKRLANHIRQVHGNLVETPPSREDPTEESRVNPWWEKKSVLPFQPCSSVWISGCTGAGKTQFVYRFLQNLHGLYDDDPPKKVMYCYGVYQEMFDQMEETLPDFTLHPGIPTWSEIEEFSDGQHHLIILDDLLHQVVQSEEMQSLIIMGCHHKKLTVILVGQNLFPQGKSARTIALNMKYLVLFQNLRDRSQIGTLARQIFPKQKGFLEAAYHDVMKEKYQYLIVDLTPHGEEKYRLRSSVFPGEDPVVYMPQKS
jgi:hypothetical protein